MAKHRAQRSKKTKKSSKIILIILICIFIYSTLNIGIWIISNLKTKRQEAVTKQVIETTSSQGEKKVNINKLKQINEDAVGLIEIPNTNINYPILQAKDNEYYLKKDIYKKYNTSGSIFMDYRNSQDFTDKNTVIFGHNLTLGMMFSELQNIQKGTIGKDVQAYIYIQDKKFTYKVFSSYKSEPIEEPINVNVTDSKKFIDEALEKSNIDFEVTPNEKDNILTLSTCDNTGKKRILVHLVKILEEAT